MDWKASFDTVRASGDTHLFNVGDTPISVATVGAIFIVILLTLIASRVVRGGVRRALIRAKVHEGTVTLAGSLTHYVVLALGFGVALETAGIGVGSLFAAGALFAVGIGFAMQSIAQNFVSGLILISGRSIRPGDVLEVDGVVSRVLRMGIRSTVVSTRDGEHLIVPNSNIVQSTVKNLTLDDSFMRLRVNVGVVYGSDMKLVRTTLEGVLATLDWRVKAQDPLVLMTGFGDNSVNFECSIWIDDPWPARRRLSDMHEAIWWALKDKGVIIAFPQLDVHLDTTVEQFLEKLADRAGRG